MLGFIILSFICSATSALMFNISRYNILWSALVGAAGWMTHQSVFNSSESGTAATFVASLLIGFLGESLAMARKKPATIFILPGIIPLVPGAGMYYTMVALQAQDMSRSAALGVQTVFTALAIACGLFISLSIFRLARRSFQKNGLHAPDSATDQKEKHEHHEN